MCTNGTVQNIKGALSVLRQSLGIKSHRRMMKNASYFTLKPFSILKIFKCLSCLLGHVEKRLD